MHNLTARLPERLPATGCQHPERTPKNVELLASNAADRRVNTLPATATNLEKLAKHLGYEPPANGSACERFLADYAAHTGRVRAIYNHILGAGGR